jgi:hypothetical protein
VETKTAYFIDLLDSIVKILNRRQNEEGAVEALEHFRAARNALNKNDTDGLLLNLVLGIHELTLRESSPDAGRREIVGLIRSRAQNPLGF